MQIQERSTNYAGHVGLQAQNVANLAASCLESAIVIEDKLQQQKTSPLRSIKILLTIEYIVAGFIILNTALFACIVSLHARIVKFMMFSQIDDVFSVYLFVFSICMSLLILQHVCNLLRFYTYFCQFHMRWGFAH